MPPATTAPGPMIEPPLAFTLLIVSKEGLVSKVHRTEPSFVEDARIPPSAAPEKTTPGMTVGAAAWAAVHPGPALQIGGTASANHARCPVLILMACSPPARAGD